MRMRELVIGVAVALCLASCTSSSDEAPKAKPTKSTILAEEASAMHEGRDYDVVATLPAKIRGIQPRYMGVSPDGIVYGEIFVEDPDAEQPIGPGSTLLTGRSTLFLLDPASARITEVLDGSTRKNPTGVTGMDADDDWVVWLESPDGGFGSGRWTLYSYERATEKTHTLGAYDDYVVLPKAELDFERLPRISGDHVVMATSHWEDKKGTKAQVLSAPLDGSAPLEELTRGARVVDVEGQGVSYVDATGTLMFRDSVSGETTVISNRTSGCRSYRAGVLVTCGSYGSGTKIRVKATDDPTTTFGPFTGDIGYADFDDGWLKFVVDPDDHPAIYAIDTDRMKLFKVADMQGGWQLMGHDMALISPFNGAKGDFTLIKLH